MQFLTMLMGRNKIKIFSLNSLTMRGQDIGCLHGTDLNIYFYPFSIFISNKRAVRDKTYMYMNMNWLSNKTNISL